MIEIHTFLKNTTVRVGTIMLPLDTPFLEFASKVRAVDMVIMSVRP